ncbi:lamin-A-like [Mugil cephalus]|uniref:lamin-A-like n=1 Tax=Mugil cephalus TaxID=48193 RepID=UPI001FB6DB95|nr:lamin-A-like [Mugil cephalus]XP_047454612.1 lamin-A-like [Mugil cephalus]XP_047454620.1 lamin-A-like [Mugil cephalus]XP_047454631.1 lamin-A-like [Mugil cephalus]XP_047454640.1 lamin-A-like [Mugil cephalus]XP_047454648.1 lamin-A-like [Mugil cephalus]XP_047454659.1 lamin-A-like [Mugil cephalus]
MKPHFISSFYQLMKQINQQEEKHQRETKELETEWEKKLKEEEKKRERAEKEVETLKRKLETESERIKPEQTQNGSSSDSQETLRDITVDINLYCRHICLRNKFDQDKPLGGRQLKVQIKNSEPITYTFDPSVEVKPGKSLFIYHPDCDESFTLPGQLFWKDLKSWGRGDIVQVSLQ